MALVLRRGLLAGLVAGLVSGAYLLVAGEPVIDQALRYEVMPAGHVEVVSRGTQHLGLVVGAVLYALALGGVFAFVAFLLEPRLRGGSAWDRSIRLAAVAFATVWLVPFLKYPANPPGVGDPTTVGDRSRLYLAMVAVSLGASVAAWQIARRLAERGVEPWRRQLAVGAGYVAVVGLALALLPQVPVRVLVPAQVLWEARLASASGQALLWAVLGAVFGVLSVRAEDRDRPEVPAGAGR
ncbi:MAG TPA: CbtA family protein [Actinomycetota bacterium]|nr:CbtA family protein [Actinomycetota bacterium]